MENVRIEIHDSTLERIDRDDDAIIAVFSAYVNRSEGRPGVDPGSGWSQTLRFRIVQGHVTGDADMLPMYLLAGYVEISGERFENTFPIPLNRTGPIKLELHGWNDASIAIEGQSIEAALTGQAIYIEEFPPNRD